MAITQLQSPDLKVVCLADAIVERYEDSERRGHLRLGPDDVRWLRSARLKYGPDVRGPAERLDERGHPAQWRRGLHRRSERHAYLQLGERPEPRGLVHVQPQWHVLVHAGGELSRVGQLHVQGE